MSVADTAFQGRAGGVGGSGQNGGGSGAIPWASKAGHVETIFTCAHRPEDPDTLATGSYGSSVKVWHVPTMDLKVGGRKNRRYIFASCPVILCRAAATFFGACCLEEVFNTGMFLQWPKSYNLFWDFLGGN